MNEKEIFIEAKYVKKSIPLVILGVGIGLSVSHYFYNVRVVSLIFGVIFAVVIIGVIVKKGFKQSIILTKSEIVLNFLNGKITYNLNGKPEINRVGGLWNLSVPGAVTNKKIPVSSFPTLDKDISEYYS